MATGTIGSGGGGGSAGGSSGGWGIGSPGPMPSYAPVPPISACCRSEMVENTGEYHCTKCNRSYNDGVKFQEEEHFRKMAQAANVKVVSIGNKQIVPGSIIPAQTNANPISSGNFPTGGSSSPPAGVANSPDAANMKRIMAFYDEYINTKKVKPMGQIDIMIQKGPGAAAKLKEVDDLVKTGNWMIDEYTEDYQKNTTHVVLKQTF